MDTFLGTEDALLLHVDMFRGSNDLFVTDSSEDGEEDARGTELSLDGAILLIGTSEDGQGFVVDSFATFVGAGMISDGGGLFDTSGDFGTFTGAGMLSDGGRIVVASGDSGTFTGAGMLSDGGGIVVASGTFATFGGAGILSDGGRLFAPAPCGDGMVLFDDAILTGDLIDGCLSVSVTCSSKHSCWCTCNFIALSKKISQN